MNNYWAFLPMRESNDLLGDPDALRERFDDDGYLLFRKVIDAERVMHVRRKFLRTLADKGWVQPKPYLMRGLAVAPPVREGDDAFFDAYDEIQKLEEFHTLAHDDALLDVMRQVVGPTAFPHPLKIARLSFPAHYEISTPPHQDYPNNQGTENLTAAWVPLGGIPNELGPLAVLRGSQRFGVLPLDTHLGAGNRQASVPLEMLEQLRWVTTEFEAGDVLLFGSLTVHASMHNSSELFMRLSVDFRYQQEGEALTPICLEPHFERLSWDDVYAGWQSKQYQYYWRDLDYQVVPMQDLNQDLDADVGEDLQAFFAYERKRDARLERRLARIGELIEGHDARSEAS